MRRSSYMLAFVLIALILPIAVFNLPDRQSLGRAVNSFVVIFSLGVSGPGLILYSLLVYNFSQVEGKKFLSAIALLIGLPWTIYIMSTLTFNIG